MKRQRIKVLLTLPDRERLEKILNSYATTLHDRLKAQVLLLTDIGEYGSKVSSKDVVTQLNISSRSVGRIREAYAKQSSIEDLFRFTGLSEQPTPNSKDNQKTNSQRRNSKYVELDNSSNETFLIEHIKCRVTLTKEERKILQNIINSGKQTTRKFNRARILLLADEGIEGPALSDEEITHKLDVSISTVCRLRRLFITKGTIDDVLSFNHNKAGRAPKIDGMVQATLIAQACSKPPEGRCRWTLRLLANKLIELNVVESISHIAVGNALKKMNLNLGNVKNG